MKVNNRRFIALAALMLAVIVLAGCTARPDQGGGITPGQGQVSDLPPFIIVGGASPAVTEPASTDLPSLPEPGTSPTTGEVITFPGGPDQSSTPVVFGSPTVPEGLVTMTPDPFAAATLAPSPVVTATPLPTPTTMILKLGARGESVKKLQQRLKALGYLKGSADGDFGKATDTALKAFQKRSGLKADGVAGPATLAKLNSNKAPRAVTPAPAKPKVTATAAPKVNPNEYLRLGNQGASVRKLQERLISLGYMAGKPTGRYDKATESAVYSFQERNVSYADGVAGPMTLTKLYSSTAKRAMRPASIVGTSLKIGLSDSQAVRNLQQRLKTLGYYAGEIDGDFGISTQNAVKAFQANNGLTADGAAGEQTLQVLQSGNARRAGSNVPANRTPIVNYTIVTPAPGGAYVTLREGNSGSLVQRLQRALRDKKYYSGTIDGKYGFDTTDAVIRFQKDNGLAQDGTAGPATQRVLFEGRFPVGS